MQMISMKLLAAMATAAGLSGCLENVPEQKPPTEAVPCVVLEPRVEALKRGLLRHPDTPDEIGEPGADIVLGTERVCADKS